MSSFIFFSISDKNISMEFNFDKKINESLIRLTAVLILADGRTKNSEIEEAIYIINSVFNEDKSMVTLSSMQQILLTKINADEELKVIKSANLEQEKKEVIVNSLINIAISDGHYHKNEADLVFKIAKELNVPIDNEIVDFIKNKRPQLLETRKLREEKKKKLDNALEDLTNIARDMKNKDKADKMLELLGKFKIISKENVSTMRVVLNQAVKTNQISQKQIPNYLLHIGKMPIEFQILLSSMAKHTPDNFIEVLKKSFSNNEYNH